MTALGTRIKGLRAERELQQRQLAEKAELTPSMVSQIESGRLTPELITRVADLAAGPAKPLDNTDFTHPYRKKMTRVFVARALSSLAGLEPAGRPAAEVA